MTPLRAAEGGSSTGCVCFFLRNAPPTTTTPTLDVSTLRTLIFNQNSPAARGQGVQYRTTLVRNYPKQKLSLWNPGVKQETLEWLHRPWCQAHPFSNKKTIAWAGISFCLPRRSTGIRPHDGPKLKRVFAYGHTPCLVQTGLIVMLSCLGGTALCCRTHLFHRFPVPRPLLLRLPRGQLPLGVLLREPDSHIHL